VRRRQLLQDFATANAELTFEVCSVCHEGAIGMKVQVDDRLHCITCKRCRNERTKNDGKSVMRFSAENDMDPRLMLARLPTLTKVEEIIIALVHPVISVYRVTGGQWKGGEVHCISFFQDPKDVLQQYHDFHQKSMLLLYKRLGRI
jgi:hypothetical protein